MTLERPSKVSQGNVDRAAGTSGGSASRVGVWLTIAGVCVGQLGCGGPEGNAAAALGSGLASEDAAAAAKKDRLPTIVSFAATPAVLDAGGTSVLTWKVRQAKTIEIDQGIGVVTGNEVAVHPVATTTYTLTAIGRGPGRTTAQVTVSVRDTWRARSPIPTPRTGAVAATVDGKIYVVGGDASTAVEAYDPATDGWTARPSYPVSPHGELTGAAVGESVFVIDPASGRVHEYTPANDAWTERASMPTDSGLYVAASWAGKVYVFGAVRASTSIPIGTVSVAEYDPSTDGWSVSSSPNFGDDLRWSGAGVAATRDTLYVVAGAFDDILWYGAVDEFDLAAHAWTVQSSDRQGIRGIGVAAVGLEGSVYAIGSVMQMLGPTLASVWQYDPVSRTATARAPMPTARNRVAAAVAGGRIYAFGGTLRTYASEVDGLATVEEYTPPGFSDL